MCDDFSLKQTKDNQTSYVTMDGYAIIQGNTYEILSVQGDYLFCKSLRNPQINATLLISNDRYLAEITKAIEQYINKNG